MGSGCAFLDDDGDPDLLVSTSNGEPLLLRNDGPPAHTQLRRAPGRVASHWLAVKLRRAGPNREGAGARIRSGSPVVRLHPAPAPETRRRVKAGA